MLEGIGCWDGSIGISGAWIGDGKGADIWEGGELVGGTLELAGTRERLFVPVGEEETGVEDDAEAGWASCEGSVWATVLELGIVAVLTGWWAQEGIWPGKVGAECGNIPGMPPFCPQRISISTLIFEKFWFAAEFGRAPQL
jgi:hypothetical protein